MVDVGDKQATSREAHARAVVRLPEPVRAVIEDGDLNTAKGPVFQTAIIAGTQAAKKTHELIPFCHPLGLEGCRIEIKVEDDCAVIDCRVKVTHKTGVEMEALTAVSVACLTVYDMVKAMQKDARITDIELVEKSGGKSGDFKRDGA